MISKTFGIHSFLSSVHVFISLMSLQTPETTDVGDLVCWVGHQRILSTVEPNATHFIEFRIIVHWYHYWYNPTILSVLHVLQFKDINVTVHCGNLFNELRKIYSFLILNIWTLLIFERFIYAFLKFVLELLERKPDRF